MNCLVTGGSGFLGKAVVSRLAKEHNVVGICYRNPVRGFVSCDIRDSYRFASVLKYYAPQVVIHSAAYRDPDYSEVNEKENDRLNIAPAYVLRKTLQDACYIVFISSDYVFDGLNPPYSESSSRRALNKYGQSKIDAEDIILTRKNSSALRIPLLIGAGQSLANSGYIGQLITTVRDKKPSIQDHYHIRFPTWIEDVADVIAFLINKHIEGPIHYCSEQGATRYDSALKIGRILEESTCHIMPSKGPIHRCATRPHNTRFSINKIKSLGYDRVTPFSSVVRNIVSRLT